MLTNRGVTALHSRIRGRWLMRAIPGQGSSFPPMAWGGSKKLFPPQGSAPWGGSKIFPLQGSAPWGGSRLQIFRPEGERQNGNQWI